MQRDAPSCLQQFLCIQHPEMHACLLRMLTGKCLQDTHKQQVTACRLDNVMREHMVDFANRMAAIQTALTNCTSSGATAEDVAQGEAMLDEFSEIVESLDNARDLQAVGGLPVLICLMQGSHASLCWRAADVLATACQNNSPVQVRPASCSCACALALHNNASQTCRQKLVLCGRSACVVTCASEHSLPCPALHNVEPQTRYSSACNAACSPSCELHALL